MTESSCEDRHEEEKTPASGDFMMTLCFTLSLVAFTCRCSWCVHEQGQSQVFRLSVFCSGQGTMGEESIATETSEDELGRLDIDLDRKSKQHNLTSHNVRNILHVSNTHKWAHVIHNVSKRTKNCMLKKLLCRLCTQM